MGRRCVTAIECCYYYLCTHSKGSARLGIRTCKNLLFINLIKNWLYLYCSGRRLALSQFHHSHFTIAIMTLSEFMVKSIGRDWVSKPVCMFIRHLSIISPSSHLFSSPSTLASKIPRIFSISSSHKGANLVFSTAYSPVHRQRRQRLCGRAHFGAKFAI